MTLLAPIWLAVGVLAALSAIALHFIARQRPAPMDLPTARFIPDLPARAASRAKRPTDLLLLLLRVLAVLLLGLAFAGPILHPERSPLVRVVLLDRSAAVAAMLDSAGSVARANLRDGDILVTFDTSATVATWVSDDSIASPRQAPGDLAAALLTGFSAAREASQRADSLEIVLVSPFDASAWTPAVLAVRSQWSGAVRVERVPLAPIDSVGTALGIRSKPDDPLTATLALIGAAATGARVRIVRDTLTPADSAWSRDSGGTLVHWPAADHADTIRDNSGAVYARDVVAVAPWVRLGSPDGPAIAWWVDGTPAAAESPLGAGCVRDVRVGVPPLGDVALATSTQRLVRALTGPCGGSRMGPVPDTLVRRLAAGDSAASPGRMARAGVMVSPATPWLLAASLLLLIIEWLARARLGRT